MSQNQAIQPDNTPERQPLGELSQIRMQTVSVSEQLTLAAADLMEKADSQAHTRAASAITKTSFNAPEQSAITPTSPVELDQLSVARQLAEQAFQEAS